MPRAREIGISIGVLPTGPTNSVLDVAGVGLGHATLVRDEPAPPEGRGTARTGVTTLLLAEDAYARPLAAGGAVLNGAGECTGFLTAAEWGLLETPVYLTSTMQLGRVYDAACHDRPRAAPGVADEVVIPVVGECDDSFLNDCRVMQVEPDDVRASYAAALASRGPSPPPTEGSVGAGTGMSCLGFKGGIGTSSRVTPAGHTVAVLLLTNFGERKRLTVDGVPVGRLLSRSGDGPPTGRLVHRRRRHRRPGRAAATAPGSPGGSGWASHARVRRRTTAAARSSSPHRPRAVPTATAARRTDLASPDAVSTTSSRPWSTPPRSRCSTRCSASSTTVGRGGNTSEGLDPARRVATSEEAGRDGN